MATSEIIFRQGLDFYKRSVNPKTNIRTPKELEWLEKSRAAFAKIPKGDKLFDKADFNIQRIDNLTPGVKSKPLKPKGRVAALRKEVGGREQILAELGPKPSVVKATRKIRLGKEEFGGGIFEVIRGLIDKVSPRGAPRKRTPEEKATHEELIGE